MGAMGRHGGAQDHAKDQQCDVHALLLRARLAKKVSRLNLRPERGSVQEFQNQAASVLTFPVFQLAASVPLQNRPSTSWTVKIPGPRDDWNRSPPTSSGGPC